MMKTRHQIYHRIKKLKYEASRANTGFFAVANNGPESIGNPLNFIASIGRATELEWVIGEVVPVKNINWYQAALKVWRWRQKTK